MSDLHKALTDLAAIHAQISRAEYYRGFQSIPVAMTGIGGLFAAAGQAWWFPGTSSTEFILYWVGVAAVNLLFTAIGLGRAYLRDYSRFQRRQTHEVLWQFTPALAAGGLITWSAQAWPPLHPALPGLWALIFALGIFASRPYFPTRMAWAAGFYFLAAMGLLAQIPNTLSPWAMGGTFGLGQLLVAAILYWDMERAERGEAKHG